MITDAGGRYALTAIDDSTLWRYDTRWRRVVRFGIAGTGSAEFIEGAGHLLVVRSHLEHSEGDLLEHRSELTVHSILAPDVTLASAVFTGDRWSFAGDTSAWAHVPEYALLPGPAGRRALVRIADDGTSDDLEHVEGARVVLAVPDSRLVVLAGGGVVTVYDPVTRHGGFRFTLQQKTSVPSMRFRKDGEELWVNDADTLLKLETKTWTVIDAAGADESDTDFSNDDASNDENTNAAFQAWSFSTDETRVVVVRSESGAVFVVNAETLEFVHAPTLKAAAVDAALVGRDQLIAVSKEGRVLRTRVQH